MSCLFFEKLAAYGGNGLLLALSGVLHFGFLQFICDLQDEIVAHIGSNALFLSGLKYAVNCASFIDFSARHSVRI